MRKGKVYIIGAGPGDPGLVTVKGRDILRQAGVVIYDYLVDKRLLNEAQPGAELICCDTLTKNRYSDGFLKHNDRIIRLVIKKAKEGKNVVRLKNGDITIFGRLSEEMLALDKGGISFELVPGVTSASAAASLNGIPLTDRRFASSVVFAAGHEAPDKRKSNLDWQALSKSSTIVLYMAVENFKKIVNALVASGMPLSAKAAVIENAGRLNQKALTGSLADISIKAKRAGVKPPAIIIIGETVGSEKRFNWLKKAKRVLYTGISSPRYFLDKVFFYLPLIKIEPLADYKEFDAKLKDIHKYDWLVFSSKYGVEYFFKRLNSVGLDARRFSSVRIAAIGNSTKNRLLDFGIAADLTAKDESSKGLINEFSVKDLGAKKVFIPRSNLSDKGLEAAFTRQGAIVTAAVAYKNVMPQNLPDIDMNFFDEIMFSSPSGVKNFIKRYGRPPKKVKISYIGDVTKKEAKKWNL